MDRTSLQTTDTDEWAPCTVRENRTITHRTYARAGLFGNPSDQYGGKTIAFSLENFYAEVTLTPSADGSPTIRIQPHPLYDSTEYNSMNDLVAKTSTQGLYGGVRLLLAACKRFTEYCTAHGIPLRPGGRPCQEPQRSSGDGDGDGATGSGGGGPGGSGGGPGGGGGGFTLSYDTTVPRQTGLSGSSAIIYSAIKCLAQWYGVPPSALPPSARPGLVLCVESEELGIAAGLQDRVVQVYGGVVHMDFGAGVYRRLDAGCLPASNMFLMFSDNPSESGKVHSGVKAKWLAGDQEVRGLMRQVIQCGDEGLELLIQPPGPGRDGRMAELMNRNADLRRALFGDGVLGRSNIRMLELARSVGAGANFCGSGGAVVVLCPAGAAQASALRSAAAAEGFSLLPVRLGPELETLPPA